MLDAAGGIANAVFTPYLQHAHCPKCGCKGPGRAGQQWAAPASPAEADNNGWSQPSSRGKGRRRGHASAAPAQGREEVMPQWALELKAELASRPLLASPQPATPTAAPASPVPVTPVAPTAVGASSPDTSGSCGVSPTAPFVSPASQPSPLPPSDAELKAELGRCKTAKGHLSDVGPIAKAPQARIDEIPTCLSGRVPTAVRLQRAQEDQNKRVARVLSYQAAVRKARPSWWARSRSMSRQSRQVGLLNQACQADLVSFLFGSSPTFSLRRWRRVGLQHVPWGHWGLGASTSCSLCRVSLRVHNKRKQHDATSWSNYYSAPCPSRGHRSCHACLASGWLRRRERGGGRSEGDTASLDRRQL